MLRVILSAVMGADGLEQTIVEQEIYTSLHSMELVLTPGNYTIRVQILDIYGACTDLNVATDIEVKTITHVKRRKGNTLILGIRPYS